MTARLPPALENGEPMVRRIRDEFHTRADAAHGDRRRAGNEELNN
jgi:hypothetical protein